MNGTLADNDTDHDQGPSLTRLFDFSAVIVVLWSCRRLIMRTTLLMCAFLFLCPTAIGSVLNSIFLWTVVEGSASRTHLFAKSP